MERRYDLVAINERTEKSTKLNSLPLTHHEACTMKSKFTSHPARRIQLVDVTHQPQ